MSEVASIHNERMKKWASIFADTYLDQGERLAGKHLVDNVPEELHAELQTYVADAFLERGYNLEELEEVDNDD